MAGLGTLQIGSKVGYAIGGRGHPLFATVSNLFSDLRDKRLVIIVGEEAGRVALARRDLMYVYPPVKG